MLLGFVLATTVAGLGDRAANAAPRGKRTLAEARPREATPAAADSGSPPPRNDARVQLDPQTLDRDEMIMLVKKYEADLVAMLIDAEHERAIAVREKDTIRLTCIQDRLLRMKLTKQLADERLADLRKPSILEQDMYVRHEFRGVEMAHEAMSKLRDELGACVSDALTITDGTRVTTDDKTAGVPTTILDPMSTNAEIPKMERPSSGSPYN